MLLGAGAINWRAQLWWGETLWRSSLLALALDRPVVAAPLVVAGEPERLVRRPLARPSRRWLGGVDVEAGGVLAPSPLRALGVVVAVDLQRGWTVFFTFFGFVSAFTVFCCCCWW